MILHIANDFGGSKVYKNLFDNLDCIGISQTVYTAIRTENLISVNNINWRCLNSKIYYRHILNNYTRLNFFHKTSMITRDVIKTVGINRMKIIHAHTWFSDGVIAYNLYKKFKIPYIVTIRNTDLNIFYKYLFYLRYKGIEVLKSASKIIVLSPVYKQRLLKIIWKWDIVSNIEKIEVIPNGIDNFWLDNIYYDRKYERVEVHDILYVGNFSRNKNLHSTIRTINKINRQKLTFRLHIIGHSGLSFSKKFKIINRYPEVFKYYGRIDNLNTLMKIYRKCHFFVMPSRTETFGLVYIEALSQDMPVLYSMNEGIDGFFNEKVGEKVNPYDLKDIESKIIKIANDYQQYEILKSVDFAVFNWKNISLRYNNIYKNIFMNLNTP